MSFAPSFITPFNKRSIKKNCFYETNPNPLHITVDCDISSEEMPRFICSFLRECEMDAFGYNTSIEKYWAKYKSELCFLIQKKEKQLIFSIDKDPKKYIFTIIKKLKEFLESYYDSTPKNIFEHFILC